MTTGTPVSGTREVTTAVERLVTALGGCELVRAAAGLRVVDGDERNHPGWGFGLEAPEEVAYFSYALVEDSVASRYRIAMKSHTDLVTAVLDYIEISRAHIRSVRIGLRLYPSPSRSRA